MLLLGAGQIDPLPIQPSANRPPEKSVLDKSAPN